MDGTLLWYYSILRIVIFKAKWGEMGNSIGDIDAYIGYNSLQRTCKRVRYYYYYYLCLNCGRIRYRVIVTRNFQE